MKWERLLDKNRRRKSTSSGDHRAEFERDFDRAVFSTPVRRLQDKAQVFPLDPHDAIRTRLTHSLEVSSVARGLATAIAKWLSDQQIIEPGMDRSIEVIAATSGLIHDLGNPPFGHAGEDAIRAWFGNYFETIGLPPEFRDNAQATEDFRKFDGNAQSLRLVAKLQVLADNYGLNLTFGTLSASCKYTAPSHEATLNAADHAARKPGYFASENGVIKEIRDATGTGTARNPITFLVEAADDIVYSVADIEDGVKKGIVSWRMVSDMLSPDTDINVKSALDSMDSILRSGRDARPDDLPDDILASGFRTAAIGILARSVIDEFKNRYHSIMAGTYGGELVKDCGAATFCSCLKRIGGERIYCTPPTLKLEIMGRHVIKDLMTLFWEGAKVLPLDKQPDTKRFPGKIGALLSENYRRIFRQFVKSDPTLPEVYHRFQLVTDYVCGMTDSFAKRLHSEVTNGN